VIKNIEAVAAIAETKRTADLIAGVMVLVASMFCRLAIIFLVEAYNMI
jgi:hypothetical protein